MCVVNSINSSEQTVDTIKKLIESEAVINLYADFKENFDNGQNWLLTFHLKTRNPQELNFPNPINSIVHITQQWELPKTCNGFIECSSDMKFVASTFTKTQFLRYTRQKLKLIIIVVGKAFPPIYNSRFIRFFNDFLWYYSKYSQTTFHNIFIDCQLSSLSYDLANKQDIFSKQMDTVKILKVIKARVCVLLFTTLKKLQIWTVCKYYKTITFCTRQYTEIRSTIIQPELVLSDKNKSNMNGLMIRRTIITSISPIQWSLALCPYPSLVKVEVAVSVIKQSGSKSYCLLKFLESYFNFSVPRYGIRHKESHSVQDFLPELIAANLVRYLYLTGLNLTVLNMQLKNVIIFPSILDENEKYEYVIVVHETFFPTLITFLEQFDYSTWIMIGITFVFILATLFGKMKPTTFPDKIKVLFWAISLLVDQASDLKSKKCWSLYTILCIWFFETFELRNLYSAGIYSLATVLPAPNLPDSYEEAYFKQYLPVYYFPYIPKSSQIENGMYPNLIGCPKRCHGKSQRLVQCRCFTKIQETYKLRRQLINKNNIAHFLKFLVGNMADGTNLSIAKLILSTNEDVKPKDYLYANLPNRFMFVNVPEYLDMLKMMTESITTRKVFKAKDSQLLDTFSDKHKGKVWMLSVGPLSNCFATVMSRIAESGIYNMWGKYVTRLKKGIRVHQFFQDFKRIHEKQSTSKIKRAHTNILSQKIWEKINIKMKSWFMSIVFGNGRQDSGNNPSPICLMNFLVFGLLCGVLLCFSIFAFLMERLHFQFIDILYKKR